MASIRAGIINWPGESLPFSDIRNRQNRTVLSSKINFLGGIQSEPWRTEIHQGEPGVLNTANWPNPTIGLSFKVA